MDTKKLPARLRKHAFSSDIPHQVILSIFKNMTKINPFDRFDRLTAGKLRVNGEQCRTIKNFLGKIVTQINKFVTGVIKTVFAGLKKK